MIALQVLAAVLILGISSIAPGFFFVRRLRWSPLEKLNASIALSLILVYCASFAIYMLHLDRRLHWLITIASLILGALAFRDLVRLLRAVRSALLAFAFLLAWCLVILLLIRHYSGGAWAYDWVEHFHRTIFFLDQLPPETKFASYHVAARPPFMNLVGAFVLAHTGARFEIYSVVFVFLSVVVLFPCVLLMRLIGRARPLFLAALFACNPFFVENVTYTWTKLLAAFYVLFGVWLYLAGSRKDDARRTIAAFLSLTAGVLVHYSAGPYLVAISLHYGVRVLREKRWKEAITGAAIALALIFTWFGWSIAAYGTTATFKTNTSVTDFRAQGKSPAEKITANVIDTILPRALLTNTLPDDYKQESFPGAVRDYTFLLFQPNLIFAMGLIGGPLVVLLALRRVRSGFWWFFLAFTILVGIAVHGAPERTGVAHVTLQPIVLLGLTFLAANFRLFPRALRWIVLLGCLADASLGVLLQTWLQSQERDTGAFRISIVRRNGAPADSPETTLSQFALRNWWMKQSRALIADTIQRPEIRDATQLKRDLEWELVLLREDDRQQWGGWYARNGERLTFLGERARPMAMVWWTLLGAMFAAALAILARRAYR
jgi:hypothetical protein